MRSRESSPSERYEWWIAVGLSVILVGVHVMLLLNRGPLWRDEISSVVLATQPTLAHFWAGLGLDPFPGFFFLLLRGWHALVGGADFALRGFGFVVGVGCIGAFWLNARLTGRRTPILLLLLLGFSPNFVVWGDSLRAYGLGIFLALLLFGLFWQLSQTVTTRRVVATTIVSVLSVHTLYTNSLLVFACAMAAVAVTVRRRQWKTTFVILGIGAISAASLLVYLGVFRQLGTWAVLGQVSYSLQESLWMLHVALLGWGRPFLWLWIILLSLGLALAFWWQFRGDKGEEADERRDPALYAAICAILTFVTTMGFYRAVGWGTNVWYYLPMLALMAAGLDMIFQLLPRPRWAALGRGAVALAGVALLSPIVFGFADTRATNIDVVAKIITKRAAPEDLVVVWPSTDAITFQRYVGKSLKWISIPYYAHHPPGLDDDWLAPYREENSLQPTLDRIRETLQSSHRVWVVSSWPLEPYQGERLPAVRPLRPGFRPSLGYYLRGWGYQLVHELQQSANRVSRVDLPFDQPINPYERSFISVFSSEKEEATAP